MRPLRPKSVISSILTNRAIYEIFISNYPEKLRQSVSSDGRSITALPIEVRASFLSFRFLFEMSAKFLK